MKILFLAYWYPTENNPLKGIFIKNHAASVASSGSQVEVLSLVIENSESIYNKKVLRFKDEKGLKTTQILIRSKFYKFFHLLLPYHYYLVKKEARQINKEFQFDILHSNVLYPAAIIGDKLSHYFKRHHVITEHWSKVNKFMQKSLYAHAGKRAYKRAGAITLVSSFLKNNITAYLPTAKTYIVPNVIKSNVFSFKAKKTEEGVIRFTAVAHWTAPKRPDIIFESLEKFAKLSSKKITLAIVGEGPLLNALKTKTWSFTVEYKGNLKSDALAELLHQTDFFLHASEVETFSIVIAEALATGTPVLASHVGAISELITVENGLLCDNDVKQWSEKLRQLTQTNYNNSKISKNSLKYSENSVGAEFQKIYNKILGH